MSRKRSNQIEESKESEVINHKNQKGEKTINQQKLKKRRNNQ